MALKLGITRALKGTVFGSRALDPFVLEEEQDAKGVVARRDFAE